LDAEGWGRHYQPNPGKFDFSKRELDFNAGIAWNWWDRFETRASAYSGGNLNRGYSKTLPDGYKDGILIETRYYFGPANIYDVSRLSFVSLGYYPPRVLLAVTERIFNQVFSRAPWNL
jgi:hypothetical protein